MKIVLLFICIAFAGCGAKSNEEIAKELITEKLKTSLPDFSKYESLNFGTMGTASLSYQETDQSKLAVKKLADLKDSIAVLEKIIQEAKTAVAKENTERLLQLQDSIKMISAANNEAKQAYIPEQLFKMTHAYTLKDDAGQEKKTEDEFYFDKDFKKVVKVRKVY